MENILQTILFILSLIGLFFVPGLVLLSLSKKIWRKTNALEKLFLSFLLGIVCIDLFMLISGKIGIPFSQVLFFSYILCFLLISIAQWRVYRQKKMQPDIYIKDNYFFSKKQTLLILGLIALTVCIKTVYLSDTIFPTSTDLGHHMYWINRIIETRTIPLYEEREIIPSSIGYVFSQPKPIADFIIGEHLPFAAYIITAHLSVLSAYPALFLLLFNLLGVLSLFSLSIRFLSTIIKESVAKKASLFTLLLAGPLYAIASPQAKYISGGVIGNIFGNVFIPTILFCFFMAWHTKNRVFAMLGTFFSFGLFYTHHLSGLILIFIIAWSVFFLIIAHRRKMKKFFKETVSVFISPHTISIAVIAILYTTFIYLPSYLNIHSVGSAIGEPEKSTRTGIAFLQLISSSGEAKCVFGLLGVIIIIFSWVKNSSIFRKMPPYTKTFVQFSPFASPVLLGWFISIFLMSWKPSWLFIDLPSGRIANYLNFPLVILGGLGLAVLFEAIQKANRDAYMRATTGIILFSFLFLSGYAENAEFVKEETNTKSATQTFIATEYLAQHSLQNEEIIKDHNYITADAWIKLFFNRGYDYPLSRAYFKRYEDASSIRETCTLHMISAPESQKGILCYNTLRTRYVMVNSTRDASQFEKNNSFWKIFENQNIAIFYRNQ